MIDNLSQAIEAILFATAEPATYTSLAQRLNVTVDDVAAAVDALITLYDGHAVSVTTLNQVVTLVTKSEYSTLIESIRKDELSKELSKASAETLAVIAYMPGVSKSQIEFIRGVNVSYSVRALMMRGLIETKGNGRAITYHPTLQLLEHFGVSTIEGLPEYAATKANIDTLMSTGEAKTE